MQEAQRLREQSRQSRQQEQEAQSDILNVRSQEVVVDGQRMRVTLESQHSSRDFGSGQA